MKNLLIVAALILSGNIYSANRANTIPGPFWYSISEKIISETQQLLSLDVKDKPAKAKVVKNGKLVRPALKCQPKKEIVLPAPYFTITSSGIWIVNEPSQAR